MKSQKKQEWIIKGYQLVAEEGFASLNVESIARSMGKNKSSFYHYFGDLELFVQELLSYHLERAAQLAEQANACANIRPCLVNLFLDYKPDHFFHKQLRINRSNPAFRQCFERVFDIYEKATLDKWANYLGLHEQPLFAKTFLHLIAENFLLKITMDNYNQEWLNNYLAELSAMLRQMNPGAPT
jgi:AcrR family transcriptional regulator